MNEVFPVIAAGGLPQKCPAPQCGTESREKQPPSNPTKTAIDPKKPSEPENFPDPAVPLPQKMPRTAMRDEIPRKTAAIKSNQDGD